VASLTRTGLRFERMSADLGHDAWTNEWIVAKALHGFKRGHCRASAWYAAPFLMGAEHSGNDRN